MEQDYSRGIEHVGHGFETHDEIQQHAEFIVQSTLALLATAEADQTEHAEADQQPRIITGQEILIK